jgi:serine/threonine-protein kinase HipA
LLCSTLIEPDFTSWSSEDELGLRYCQHESATATGRSTMTSDIAVGEPKEAYVWVWLPGAIDPVVAGRLTRSGERIVFTYGTSYLNRPEAIALYLPELPLQRGRIQPLSGNTIAGCIADAGPDAWGQRVIVHRRFGRDGRNRDPASINELTYLLESGSDRVGALDFQSSASTYVARSSEATLEELQMAATRFDAGEPFSPTLDAALLHGSSLGGARPKALLDEHGRKLIAKFSSATDPYPVVKAEAVAMELARRVGINAAFTEITSCLGRDVLLVDRFDRTAAAGTRRLVVSALTMLGLHELIGRYATYHDLADVIRQRFVEPEATLRELFRRIVFNICVSNTDDHARNHAAFWDGTQLTLTPAYDICPQLRSGGETAQAMAIGRDGFRASQLAGCVNASPTYLLSGDEARAIINHQLDVVNTQWNDAADAARLTAAERKSLWGRQILNPYALYDYDTN